MPDPLRIVFAVSECAPLVKTGGLADVAGALPAALRAADVEVTLLIPGYRTVLDAVRRTHSSRDIAAPGEIGKARLLEATLADDVTALVVDRPDFYLRPGGPYQDPTGQDWPDNALRFGLLSYTAALLGAAHDPLGMGLDIVHCNDWQTALAPAYLHWGLGPGAATVLTIHNLAYQGIFPPGALAAVGLPDASFNMNGVEFYGNFSFLKAGLYYADRITTVSPTYAREIQSEALGFGMQGLLAGRSASLEGILNGVDTGVWSPATDPLIPTRYDRDTLDAKRLNTRALRQRLGLADRPDMPLLGVVSRLVFQKGLDLIAEVTPQVLALPAQIVVMGTGDRELEQAMRDLALAHPGAVAYVDKVDEALAHQVEAGADAFLMPSRFEPCGLNQMYSQAYGTPPIVHRTGGLADSVTDTNMQTIADGTASGFVFEESTAPALLAAIGRAVRVWHDRDAWRTLQRNGMARDFGWHAAARAYVDMYRRLPRRA